MKTIPQMAETLDISSGTIREYLQRFEEFFADPVEHEGVKEYPNETAELVTKIYGYYQNSGMTKEEIRVKLGGAMALEANPELAALQAQAVPMDMEKFDELGEKIDKLTIAIETLTSTFNKIFSEESVICCILGDSKGKPAPAFGGQYKSILPKAPSGF